MRFLLNVDNRIGTINSCEGNSDIEQTAPVFSDDAGAAARRISVIDSAVVAIASLITGAIFFVGLRGDDVAESKEPHASELLHQHSTSDLLRLPRNEDVCHELFCRADVPPKSLIASLTRLTKLTGCNYVEVMLDLLPTADRNLSVHCIRNLSLVYSKLAEEQQGLFREQLSSVAQRDGNVFQRRAAFSLWITLDNSPGSAFASVRRDQNSAKELLKSLTLLPTKALQSTIYGNIRGFLPLAGEAWGDDAKAQNKNKNETAAIAIDVMVRLAGHEPQKVADLMRLIRQRQFRPEAFRALLKLPAKSWPDADLNYFASDILEFIAEQPAVNPQSDAVRSAAVIGERLVPMLPEDKRRRFSTRLRTLMLKQDSWAEQVL